MKFAAFCVYDYETEFFASLAKKYSLDIDLFPMELADCGNMDLSHYDGISLAPMKKISHEIIDRMTSCKIIALRTIGYDAVDKDYCTKKNIVLTNACYEPYNVADFAIMLMLMTLRKAKVSVCRALVNDFSLDGMRGAEMRNQTIGIIGTGKIGSTVIKELSGFGCKIYCNDKFVNEKVLPYAEYKDLDFLYQNCDIISLHTSLNPENIHLIDKEAIRKMKDGVILINTARGKLMDIEALIEGIESQKIGALGIDTIEGEEGLSHVDVGTRVAGLSSKRDIMYLKQFANVIFTQHVAFFTKEATYSMVDCSLSSLKALVDGTEYRYKVN